MTGWGSPLHPGARALQVLGKQDGSALLSTRCAAGAPGTLGGHRRCPCPSPGRRGDSSRPPSLPRPPPPLAAGPGAGKRAVTSPESQPMERVQGNTHRKHPLREGLQPGGTHPAPRPAWGGKGEPDGDAMSITRAAATPMAEAARSRLKDHRSLPLSAPLLLRGLPSRSAPPPSPPSLSAGLSEVGLPPEVQGLALRPGCATHSHPPTWLLLHLQHASWQVSSGGPAPTPRRFRGGPG